MWWAWYQVVTSNGKLCSGMGPVEFYRTAYRVYLGKAPLLVQYIAPEQRCLLEAGQLYGSPLILDKTGNNRDSGQANTDTHLSPVENHEYMWTPVVLVGWLI